MIKFLSLDKNRIPRKIINAVYSLQISASAPEIFKFQKCVKYANEGTDDVIDSTLCNIKCSTTSSPKPGKSALGARLSIVISPIPVNLQQRPLKLGAMVEVLGRFPFVRTGRPDPSVCKENATI